MICRNIRREPSRHAKKHLAALGFMVDSNLVVTTYTHKHENCGACAGIPVLSDEDGHGDGVGVFCGGEFVCNRCKGQVGWCFGCADGVTDGLCDACAVEVLDRCRP